VDALATAGQRNDTKNIAMTIAEYKNFLIVGSPC
jgi:hypothetical protein